MLNEASLIAMHIGGVHMSTIDTFKQTVQNWGIAIGIIIVIIIGITLLIKRNVMTFITSAILAILAFILIVAPEFIENSAKNLNNTLGGGGGIQF